jgi:hypothetical protein
VRFLPAKRTNPDGSATRALLDGAKFVHFKAGKATPGKGGDGGGTGGNTGGDGGDDPGMWG